MRVYSSEVSSTSKIALMIALKETIEKSYHVIYWRSDRKQTDVLCVLGLILFVLGI